MTENKNIDEKENFKDNSDFIVTISLVYFISFVLKKVILWAVKSYQNYSFLSNKQTKVENKVDNSIKQEIEKLKKEAEMFNNPQNFVKYVKLQRQISNLQKELESTLIRNEKEQIIEQTPLVSLPETTYLRIVLEVVYYFLHLMAIYYFRNFSMIIYKNKYNNILFDYYTRENTVEIPVNVIFILEGIFIHNLSQIGNKVSKLLVK